MRVSTYVSPFGCAKENEKRETRIAVPILVPHGGSNRCDGCEISGLRHKLREPSNQALKPHRKVPLRQRGTISPPMSFRIAAVGESGCATAAGAGLPAVPTVAIARVIIPATPGAPTAPGHVVALFGIRISRLVVPAITAVEVVADQNMLGHGRHRQ